MYYRHTANVLLKIILRIFIFSLFVYFDRYYIHIINGIEIFILRTNNWINYLIYLLQGTLITRIFEFNESTNEIKNSVNIIIGEKRLKIFLSTNQELLLFTRKTITWIIVIRWIHIQTDEFSGNFENDNQSIINLLLARDPCNWNTLWSRISGGRERWWWRRVRERSEQGRGGGYPRQEGGQNARWTRLKTGGVSRSRLLERASRLTPAPLPSASASHRQVLHPEGQHSTMNFSHDISRKGNIRFNVSLSSNDERMLKKNGYRSDRKEFASSSRFLDDAPRSE